MASKVRAELPDLRARRSIFVNRFYAPDMSATSQILTDVAEAMVEKGHEILVVTSRMSYDGRDSYAKYECLHGVRIRRIWSTKFGRRHALGRAFDYVTFYLSVSIYLLFTLSRNDILVAKTDPPLLSIPLGGIARLKRSVRVNWLQDIFPEVAFELGVGSSDSILMRTLKGLRTRSLRTAHINVAIGQRMFDTISDFGIDSERIRIMENFVDDTAIVPLSDQSQALRSEWQIGADDFIVGYSGNLGRAHDLTTILEAATLLQNQTDIKFLFIGGGYLHAQLKQETQRRGLDNIILKSYQPRARLPESLAVPNLHWASLNPKLEGYIVPSKVYGIAAAGKPLLMVGDADGEIGKMISKFDFGACVSQGDAHAAAAFIMDCKQSPEHAAGMGANARQMIDKSANREKVLMQWDQLLTELAEHN